MYNMIVYLLVTVEYSHRQLITIRYAYVLCGVCVDVIVMCNSGDISIYRDMKFHIVI